MQSRHHGRPECPPAIGGLFLSKDEHDWLTLHRGFGGRRVIRFEGCLAGVDVVIGRGLVPHKYADRVVLRLERLGDRVRALCSPDAAEWFTVGETAFPLDDPVQVGLVAFGHINRAEYPGEHRHGSAIRFESFDLWASEPTQAAPLPQGDVGPGRGADLGHAQRGPHGSAALHYGAARTCRLAGPTSCIHSHWYFPTLSRQTYTCVR